MNQPLLVALAIVLNVSAQLSIKFAGQRTQGDSLLQQFTSPWLLGALALYGLSFVLTVRIYAVNALSVAAPVMAACTFVLIYVLSYALLREPITLAKVGGLGLIVAGIYLVLR